MKSHVSMEQNVCPVCGTTFDTGAILFDKRLRESMESKTTTGWSFCPEHGRLRDEGYIALVGIDDARSTRRANGNYDPSDVYRTGKVAHLRREAAARLFAGMSLGDIAFCEDEAIDRLEAMQQASGGS